MGLAGGWVGGEEGTGDRWGSRVLGLGGVGAF